MLSILFLLRAFLPNYEDKSHLALVAAEEVALLVE